MVELVPPEFFKWMIAKIKKTYPGLLFIAEVYQKELYAKYIREVGFDLLYDKSGIYDAVRDIVAANVSDSGMPIEDWQSAKRITWNWQSLGDLQTYMLNFLENHDEQRFASDFFGNNAENAFSALYASTFFNKSSFMLYAGQEIGERGMDEEGFSGKDGRTSIFDWWSPSGLNKLYRFIHGEQDALTDAEQQLLDKYKSVLTTAASDLAMSEGMTYDLCYCNLASDGFNSDRHFAFLRDFKDETLLVVCNFSQYASELNISIPEHAFKWMALSETETLNHNTPIRVKIPAMDGAVVTLCK